MTPSTLLIITLVGAATGFVAFLVLRLMQYRGEPDKETSFSPARYAPMSRLLDPEEIAFLAGQPGTTRGELAEFRKERRGIFRLYLRELAADFSALNREARELVAASPEKSPELVEMLMRQQASFWGALLCVEAELALDAAGIHLVNPARLLENAAQLHAALLRATAVPGPIPVS